MIKVLPQHVADQIAAGEVIERPASVVKELVENSIDAGASAIRVDIEDGGKRLIRVIDDGCGMDEDDLRLAFVPHATSKIAGVDDLFRVASFGFRGEALASIGAVARSRIVSRRHDRPLGAQISCEGGELSPVLAAGASVGTLVEARDLFFNVPVRLKFTKAAAAETAAVSEQLTRLALPHPEIDFSLYHGDREVFKTSRARDFEARIVDLFGRDVKGKLLSVSGGSDSPIIEGFVGTPEAARPSAAMQYVFLNGRFIRDKSIAQAVIRGFEGFLMPRRHPLYFLRISINPADVDVNVHPTKIEVRFKDKNSVFGAVFVAVRRALESAHGGSVVLPSRLRTDEAAGLPFETPAVDGSPGRSSIERVAEDDSTNSSPPAAVAPSQPVSRRVEVAPDPAEGRSTVTSSDNPCARKEPPGWRDTAESLYRGHSMPVRPPTPEPKKKNGQCAAVARPAVIRPGTPERFIQMHDSFLIVEEYDGIGIYDQHALHERMLFEGLMARTRDSARQPLLVPFVIDASPTEREKLRAAIADLEELGVVVAEFGRSSLALQEVPLDLAKASPERLINAVLDLEEERLATGFEDIRRAMAAGMACRAAVKFNDRLPDDDIRALLSWFRRHPHAAACPHGRPVRLKSSLDELEQRFLRKV